MTIPGVSSLTVKIYYETESGCDYVYLYQGTSASGTAKASLSGTGHKTSPATYTITGNSATFKFTSDGSINKWGYWAEVSTTGNTQDLISGTYTKPSKTNYIFKGWSTNPAATTPDWTYDPYSPISTDLTVYAVWGQKPTTMQEMTPEYCASMAANATMTLTDERDDNEYTIVKLGSPINNCWMQQNLRLGKSGTSYTLDSTNSNLPSGTTFTLGSAQTSGSTDWGCSSDSACQTSRVYATNKTNYGNYYSWYTATANTGTYSMSSGNATGSICPKGWRLPTGGSSGEFKTLNNTYNSGSTSSDAGLLADPLKLVRAGYYYSGVRYRGSYGYYWSSTVGSGTLAYGLYFDSVLVTPAYSDNKYLGYSVRCLSSS